LDHPVRENRPSEGKMLSPEMSGLSAPGVWEEREWLFGEGYNQKSYQTMLTPSWIVRFGRWVFHSGLQMGFFDRADPRKIDQRRRLCPTPTTKDQIDI
jgi:hypothetical protein